MTERRTMTGQLTEGLVLRDQAGNCYFIPRETIEACQVSDERKAEIEAWFAEREVEGYNPSLVGLGMAAAAGAAAAVVVGGAYAVGYYQGYQAGTGGSDQSGQQSGDSKKKNK